MKIVVFGATGGLGQQFLNNALAKGHEIITYVRSPEKIQFEHENLKVIVGDVFDKQKIVDTLKGVDAAFITWRMRTQHIPLFSEGTQNVVDALNCTTIVHSSTTHYLENECWVCSEPIDESKPIKPYKEEDDLKPVIKEDITSGKFKSKKK